MRIPIVNEKDEIIGDEERSIIHKHGLRHREIHVWLVTPNKEFVFQKRGLHQDTWPGFLDVTVGGHLDTANETYLECAERELLEETGVRTPLAFIMKIYSESYDPNTGTHNNAFRSTFAAIFSGNMADLNIEQDAGLGFTKFSLDEIQDLTEEQKQKMIPRFYSEEYMKVYEKIISVLFK